MIYIHQEISDELRTYFKNDYMGFSIQGAYYELSVNGKKYELLVKIFEQQQDLKNYVINGFKDKFPELFL